MKTAYKCYFGCKVGDQDKKWAPHICCNSCNTQLLRWAVGKQKEMPFAVPMIWREPTDHVTVCYFCLTNTKGFSKKNKSKIVYPSCQSALKPVPHGTDIPISKAPPPEVLNIQSLHLNQTVPVRLRQVIWNWLRLGQTLQFS